VKAPPPFTRFIAMKVCFCHIKFLMCTRTFRSGSKALESLIPLAGTVRELLRHKVCFKKLFAISAVFVLKMKRVLSVLIFCCSQNRLQEMKHFRQDGMQKQLNIIVLLCHTMWSHVLLRLFVSAIALLHTKH
jgi:hypothetical protein